MEARLQLNFQLLSECAPCSVEQIEISQEVHFQSVADEDFVWILNVEDFMKVEIPEWLTFDTASAIYSEIGEMTEKITDSEQERLQIQIDFDTEESNYVRRLAIDLKLREYGIDERMLKKVIFMNQNLVQLTDEPQNGATSDEEFE